MTGQPVRYAYKTRISRAILIWGSLYTKGRVLGFKRAKRNQRENTSLVQLDGVKCKEGKNFTLSYSMILISIVSVSPLFRRFGICISIFDIDLDLCADALDG